MNRQQIIDRESESMANLYWKRGVVAARDGEYLMGRIKKEASGYKVMREVRGMGLMIGVELRFEIINVMNRCQDAGVLTLEAGRNILRLLPPLIIDRGQIDRAASTIVAAIGVEEAERFPK